MVGKAKDKPLVLDDKSKLEKIIGNPIKQRILFSEYRLGDEEKSAVKYGTYYGCLIIYKSNGEYMGLKKRFGK